MRLAPLGALATGIVVAVGIILVIPSYIEKNEPPSILLSFAITHDVATNNNNNSSSSSSGALSKWCNDLAGVLETTQVKAMVFVSGKVAQSHPECVKDFSRLGFVDVGSETFSYATLTSLGDYSLALKEVQGGKMAVDSAGGIDSKLFRAPASMTDANIYSLLERSGILVDFSYSDHYNRYENNQFVRYPLTRIENPSISQALFDHLSTSATPTMLEFDNSVHTNDIHQFITELKSATSGKVRIVDASSLVGRQLTAEKGGQA
jgi:hypothetical protein